MTQQGKNVFGPLLLASCNCQKVACEACEVACACEAFRWVDNLRTCVYPLRCCKLRSKQRYVCCNHAKRSYQNHPQVTVTLVPKLA